MLEYEQNLKEATRQTENIQAELAKLDQEKLLHEQKSNTVVHSLKQEYESQFEAMKAQMAVLQEKGLMLFILLAISNT